jgi:hypothetical protein
MQLLLGNMRIVDDLRQAFLILLTFTRLQGTHDRAKAIFVRISLPVFYQVLIVRMLHCVATIVKFSDSTTKLIREAIPGRMLPAPQRP